MVGKATRDQRLWYVTWAVMACNAVTTTLTHVAWLGAGPGLITSAVLISAAALQIARGCPFLSEVEGAAVPIALVLFGFAQGTQALRNPGANRAIDFGAYYVAGKLMAETPAQSPYRIPLYADGRMQFIVPASPDSQWQAAASHYHVATSMPFIYPPLVAVLLKPMARLSFDLGYLAWKAMSVTLLLAGLAFALQVSGIPLTRRLAVVLEVGIFSSSPILYDILLGQTGAVLLFLLSVSVWLLVRGHTALSALSFALATLIKLTPLLAIPILVLHRRWRWLGWYAVSVTVLAGYSIWESGWELQRQFWREVLPSIACGASVCQNSSVVAWVQELFLGSVPTTMDKAVVLPAMACTVSRLVAFAVYCAMLVRFYRQRIAGDAARDLVVMVLVGLAVSPITWWHHYTIALLPFLYLWGRGLPRQRGLLAFTMLTVGTNLFVLATGLVEQHAIQLMLAAVVPMLTLTLAFRALSNSEGEQVVREFAQQSL
jgi:hypothetical protein